MEYPIKRIKVGPNEYDKISWCQECEKELDVNELIWEGDVPYCEECHK